MQEYLPSFIIALFGIVSVTIVSFYITHQKISRLQGVIIFLFAAFIFFTGMIIVAVSLDSNDKDSNENQAATDFPTEFTKEDAKKILIKKYPELDKENILPPQLFYYFEVPERKAWQIVHTVEGSGVEQIFSAKCFEVTPDGVVKELGEYEYKPTSGFVLRDIKGIDSEDCGVVEE